ncbi:MAG TPA: hypothetical protein VM492_13505 [Sumerlaeia bacterium]|nr:hypothetical protein [Sumerlaeia bacterium]
MIIEIEVVEELNEACSAGQWKATAALKCINDAPYATAAGSSARDATQEALKALWDNLAGLER